MSLQDKILFSIFYSSFRTFCFLFQQPQYRNQYAQGHSAEQILKRSKDFSAMIFLFRFDITEILSEFVNQLLFPSQATRLSLNKHYFVLGFCKFCCCGNLELKPCVILSKIVALLPCLALMQ